MIKPNKLHLSYAGLNTGQWPHDNYRSLGKNVHSLTDWRMVVRCSFVLFCEIGHEQWCTEKVLVIALIATTLARMPVISLEDDELSAKNAPIAYGEVMELWTVQSEMETVFSVSSLCCTFLCLWLLSECFKFQVLLQTMGSCVILLVTKANARKVLEHPFCDRFQSVSNCLPSGRGIYIYP